MLASAPGRLLAGTSRVVRCLFRSLVPGSCCWEAGAGAELPAAAAAVRSGRLAAPAELGLQPWAPVLGAQDSRSRCEGCLTRLSAIEGDAPVLGLLPKHLPQQGASRRRRLVQQPRCLRRFPDWALRPLGPRNLAGTSCGGPAGLPAWEWQGCTRAAAAGLPALPLSPAPLLARGSTPRLLLRSRVGCSAVLPWCARLVPGGACPRLWPPSGSPADSETDSSAGCSPEVAARSECATGELAPSSVTTERGALLPTWGLQGPSVPSRSRVSHASAG